MDSKTQKVMTNSKTETIQTNQKVSKARLNSHGISTHKPKLQIDTDRTHMRGMDDEYQDTDTGIAIL